MCSSSDGSEGTPAIFPFSTEFLILSDWRRSARRIHSRFSTTNAIAAETGIRAGIVTTTPFLGDTDMRSRLTPDLFIKGHLRFRGYYMNFCISLESMNSLSLQFSPDNGLSQSLLSACSNIYFPGSYRRCILLSDIHYYKKEPDTTCARHTA